jgi:subtilisin family serine protease
MVRQTQITDLIRLTGLMELSTGNPEVRIGLIDGPVSTEHPGFVGSRIITVPGGNPSRCSRSDSAACLHGTFAAGILCARRGSEAPAICPGCTLLVRPIFSEISATGAFMPSATPEDLATAIIDCTDARAAVINLSLALAQPSVRGERDLEWALDYAFRRGTLVIAAAGNQSMLASSAITRHPWVLPVVAYGHDGRLLGLSNFGPSIGRQGLGAPGDDVISLAASGASQSGAGTSVAAPFVTGTVALLYSEFPKATPAQMRLALMQGNRRRTIVPPLLDAMAAYVLLKGSA